MNKSTANRIKGSRAYETLARLKGGDMVMRLLRGGLFYQVRLVAEAAYIAEKHGRRFQIEWRPSDYFDPTLNRDPWTAFFEPVFPDAQPRHPFENASNLFYEEIYWNTEGVISPLKFSTLKHTRTWPRDRHVAHAILSKYIRFNETTQAFVDDFATNYLDGPIVAAHIRGPMGTHGGALEMRQMLDPGSPVPFGHYFSAIDSALDQNDEARLFVCSDSQEVIDRVIERYGRKRTLTYPAQRSQVGEMHSRLGREANQNRSFPKYKLGIDVLVEAAIMARSVHFIHGRSDVAVYVVCANPDLPTTYVYKDVEEQYFESVRPLHEKNVREGLLS